MIVSVRFQMLHPDAKLPRKSTDGSAFYDVYSCENNEVPSHSIVPIRTGIKVKPTVGWFLDVRPRSGLAKKGITLANSPGVIDSDYTGELILLVHNTGKQPYAVSIGDRVAQMAIFESHQIRFIESHIGDSSEHLGFGSTGR